MPGDIGNYAGGGALALLLIREVFGFLSKHKKDVGNSGELDPADWEARIRRIVEAESERLEKQIEARAMLLADKTESLRRIHHNTRDIVRDIAKKLGLKVNYIGD